MKTIRTLSFWTAGFAYALIVLGAVVRITESGMGCGDDWPLCNGQVIPAFTDHHVVIEYFHRIAALGLMALMAALALYTFARRRDLGVSGPRGPLWAVLLALVLLVAQVLLGAITVWLELHASAVILHLGTALAFLATLMLAGFRAGPVREERRDGLYRGIMAALALSALTILIGGLTATTGASIACQGFPLCNGEIWPASGGGLAHVHWMHRLLAYGLFLHLVGLAMRARRRSAPQVRPAVWTAAAVATAQVIIAAAMVLSLLPASLRALHAAFGVGVWVALVWAAWRARYVIEAA
jgi:heme A synthase